MMDPRNKQATVRSSQMFCIDMCEMDRKKLFDLSV